MSLHLMTINYQKS